ncbi:hypothetical protein BLL37_00070 [Pseudomonas azotoformans]|uniref:Uncharacterized protein n=1 Tax=Pseudomonas azotoformans TaxID=47878 RepID=A0A1V2JRM6_PSEAZ|nr:hypothetical protein [Pseudomonas azotoformans]OIN44566.1 hypothetical protein BFL39_25880 [Pseudomonas azotoformans]ONH47785.1 hypothetical protein BLL37_00070 [Pseudomonas azotoformans]SDN99148.1 hypothetical protein SAMN04489799_3388 [Pseudomonas azotoformans]
MSNLTAFNTTEPAIYISLEYSDDYDDYKGTGSWTWVAKRSWSYGGAVRTEVFEVPQGAEGADNEDVVSMIKALTRAPEDSDIKYAVAQMGDTPSYVAVRVE